MPTANPSMVLDHLSDLIVFWRSRNGRDWGDRFMQSMDRTAKSLGGRLPVPDWWLRDGTFATLERKHLDEATPFYVAGSMIDVIDEAAKTMPGQPLRETDLPSPSGFVLLARPIHLPDRHGNHINVQAFRWNTGSVARGDDWQKQPAMTLTLYSHKRGTTLDLSQMQVYDETGGMPGIPDLLLFHWLPWVFGMDYQGEDDGVPHDQQEDPANLKENTRLTYMRRWLAAFWSIIQEPISTIEHVTPDRKLRKRLERAETLEHISRINFVTLRRPSVERGPTDGQPLTRQPYSHRFKVRGHWRNQWYPSLGEHRQKWINEFVKGPEGADYIAKPTVYVVRR
jgi:hypothetical protein